MGLTQPFKAKSINSAELTLIKRSKLGRHYHSKIINQEYLLIEYTADLGTNYSIPISMMAQHLNQRLKIKCRNIPGIIEFQQSQLNFCDMFPSLNLWMKHPSKSLWEEINERYALKEAFEEGEIWMIMHSVQKALISYESLGLRIKLCSQIIFISFIGQIIVSDAHIYSNGKFLLEKGWKRDPIQNIHIMLEIVQKILLIPSKRKIRYSENLYALIEKLRSKEVTSYQKAISEIIHYKSQLERMKMKGDAVVPKENLLTLVESEYVYYDSQDQSRYPVNALSEIYIENQNIPSVVGHTKANKCIKMGNRKFYRTTPIDCKSILEKLNHNFNNTTNIIGGNKNEKTWNSVLDLSSISEVIKTLSENQMKDENIGTIDRLFGAEEKNPVQNIDNSSGLLEKNKQFLQGLIMRQKNMILEVPESQCDLESIKSVISPSRRVSLLSVHNLNTIPENLNIDEVF